MSIYVPEADRTAESFAKYPLGVEIADHDTRSMDTAMESHSLDLPGPVGHQILETEHIQTPIRATEYRDNMPTLVHVVASRWASGCRHRMNSYPIQRAQQLSADT